MRISELTPEGRKAFEAHLLSTYRYDAATGKLINKKWNREYPGVIKDNGYVYVWVFFRGEQFRIRKHRVSHSENEVNKLRRWKKNPDSGLPGIHKKRQSFSTFFRQRELRSSIPEMLFFHLTLLGRRYE